MSATYEAVSAATKGASLRQLGAVVGKSKDQVRRDLISESISADALIAIARHWNYSPVRLLIECGRLTEEEVRAAVGAVDLDSLSDRALAQAILKRVPREGDHIFLRPLDTL